jgi:hypothetical protein
MEAVIEVFVCRGFSGEIVRLSLPAHLPVGQLLEHLRRQLQMWSDPEMVGLYNLTQDFEYLPEDTLARRGTRAGDLLLFAAGGGCRRG